MPPLVRQAGGVLLGAGLAFGVVYASTAGWKGVGRALDRHWEQNTGVPDRDDTLRRTPDRDASLDAVHEACARRSQRAGLNPAHARMIELLQDIDAMERAVARSSAYLDCLVTERPTRFCAAPHRTHLAEAVRDHLTTVRKAREAWAFSPAGMAGPPSLTFQVPPPSANFALLRNGGSAASEPAVRLGLPSAAPFDARVASGLRSLVSKGYVAERDFAPGWFGAPPEVRQALENVAAQAAPCKA